MLTGRSDRVMTLISTYDTESRIIWTRIKFKMFWTKKKVKDESQYWISQVTWLTQVERWMLICFNFHNNNKIFSAILWYKIYCLFIYVSQETIANAFRILCKRELECLQYHRMQQIKIKLGVRLSLGVSKFTKFFISIKISIDFFSPVVIVTQLVFICSYKLHTFIGKKNLWYVVSYICLLTPSAFFQTMLSFSLNPFNIFLLI